MIKANHARKKNTKAIIDSRKNKTTRKPQSE